MIGRPCVRRKHPARVTSLTCRGIDDPILLKNGVIWADVLQVDIPELAPVGLKLQIRRTEFRVALAAVFLVMAPGAVLRVVLGLQRMNFEPVAAVALGRVIGPVIFGGEFCIDPASLVAVEAEGLLVAVRAVLLSLFCQGFMGMQPVLVMCGSNPFPFMTAIAIGNLHIRIIFMGLSRGFFFRLLLNFFLRGFLGDSQLGN